MQWLLRWLPHILEDGLAALAWGEAFIWQALKEANWLQTTGGAADVSSRCLTGDCLEGQQLDVFPTRVCRAVVLGQSATVFLVGALHLLHRLGLWQGEEWGGDGVRREEDGRAAETRVELTRFAEDSSCTSDRMKNCIVERFKSKATERHSAIVFLLAC